MSALHLAVTAGLTILFQQWHTNMHVAVVLRSGYLLRHSITWAISSGAQLIIPGRMSQEGELLAAAMQHMEHPGAVRFRRELKGLPGQMTVI